MPFPVKRVLVADDDPEFRELVIVWLESVGVETLAAGDGVEACEVIERTPVDLLLLDLLLPRRDGYGVLLHVRGGARSRALPVLIVSGEPQGLHDVIAPALGADGFLAKPFTRAELLSTIERVMAETSARSGA